MTWLASIQAELTLPSPVIRIDPGWARADSITLLVKRDDLIHPVISGNKWRKLSGILSALPGRPARILSFGGGYSNHLHALGYLCNKLSVPFTAVVRGHYNTRETPMLSDLIRWQAELIYVDKTTYRQRNDSHFLATLMKRFPGALIITEGGSHPNALAGVSHIIAESGNLADTIITPVASGGTLAGIASSLQTDQRAIGIGVLKGANYLDDEVSALLKEPCRGNWQIDHRFHCGGYAKSSPALDAFCEQFSHSTGIPIEPVYSGKLFFALKSLVESGYFAPGERVLAIHTGGLQGAR